jgi:tetratricopeptide (TPR) repeat protein
MRATFRSSNVISFHCSIIAERDLPESKYMNGQPLPRCGGCGHVLGRRDKKCPLCGTVLERSPRSSLLPDAWILAGAGLVLLAVVISLILNRPRSTAGFQTQKTITHQGSGGSAGTQKATIEPDSRGEELSASRPPSTEVAKGFGQNAVQALASGQASLKSGDYDGAIRAFNEVLRLEPNSAEALANRGLAYLFKADYDMAIADFAATIQVRPTSDLFANRASAHFNKAEYDRAIQDYTEAIRLSPSDPELFNGRGASYAGLHDYDRAIQDYDRAILLKPDPIALNNRGWVYSQKGNRERAIADYLSALKLKPNDFVRQHVEAALRSLGFKAATGRGRLRPHDSRHRRRWNQSFSSGTWPWLASAHIGGAGSTDPARCVCVVDRG